MLAVFLAGITSWMRAIPASADATGEQSGTSNDPTAADKSEYHLFHPTPRQWLREFSTDRPDKTESPYTVDAGHFQLELDLVSHARDRERAHGVSGSLDAWAVAPINLKAGLLNRVDLQFILETYNHVRTRTDGTRETRHGFGDITARLKWNLWGDDGGPTALAVMPLVKLPTNQDHLGNNGVEGGLILPFAWRLPLGLDLGMMTEVDIARDEDNAGYHPELVNSMTVSHDLVGKLSAYVEFWSSVNTERGSRWLGTFDVGFAYGLTENTQIDAGLNIGLTRAADDFNPFVGFSWRF